MKTMKSVQRKDNDNLLAYAMQKAPKDVAIPVKDLPMEVCQIP